MFYGALVASHIHCVTLYSLSFSALSTLSSHHPLPERVKQCVISCPLFNLQPLEKKPKTKQ